MCHRASSSITTPTASEAEAAYRRALDLEEDSFDETDADELLDELLNRGRR